MKRYFLFPYLVVIFATTLYSAYLWLDQQYSKAVILLFACGPVLLFMVNIIFSSKARSRRYLWPELFLALLALAYAIYIQNYHVALLSVAFGVMGLLLYELWYCSLNRPPTKLLDVGQPLPRFELNTPSGETIYSMRFATQKTIWVFIRGSWCPVCLAQVKELATLLPKNQSTRCRACVCLFAAC